MNETQRILTGALELLNGGDNWLKGRYHDGEDLADPLGGTCFCTIGAVDHVIAKLYPSDPESRDGYFVRVCDALSDAAQERGYMSAVRLNDHESTKFPLVREMFTKAIELAAGAGE